MALSLTTPALANGVDLPKRNGTPGEVISVVGHDWLACCPKNTPVRHVRLFLLVRDRRILLFDTSPNDSGDIATSFTVPTLRPGRYQLEACSEGLQGGDPNFTPICLPEGRFRILDVPQLPNTGADSLVPVAVSLIVLGMFLMILSFLRTGSQPTKEDRSSAVPPGGC